MTRFDDSLRRLFAAMVEAMREAEGIGLAAQQIGRAMQFCVVDVRGMDPDFDYKLDGAKPPLELFMPMGICNPVVEVLPSEETVYEEGCLSFPGIRGDVDRPDAIRCRFQDIEGGPHILECDGLLARCIQHEVDHLNGALYIDRMKRRILKKIQPDVDQLKARTERRLARG